MSTLPAPSYREGFPAPRLDTESVRTYILNKLDVQLVVRELHKQSLWESVKTQIFGPPGGQVLSLLWIPMVKHRLPVNEMSVSSITVGTKDIGVDGRRCNSELVHVKYGNIFTNYESKVLPANWIRNKAKFKLFLPMIGTIDVDPADIFAHNLDEDKALVREGESDPIEPWSDNPYLNISYFVNLTNGRATCHVSNSASVRLNLGLITGDDTEFAEATYGQNAFFSQDCAWGYEIPLAVESNRTGPLATIRQLTKGVIGGGENESYTVGSISSDQTLTADLNPRMLIYVPETVLSDAEHAGYHGIPAGGKRVRVSECQGFMQIREILDEVAPEGVPIRHYEELASLLKEGVYI